MKYFLSSALFLFSFLIHSTVLANEVRPGEVEGFREKGIALLEDDLIAESKLAFEQMAAAVEAESIEGIEAAFYLGLTDIMIERETLGWRSESLKPQLERIAELAETLKKREETNGGTRWLDVYFQLAKMENERGESARWPSRLDEILAYWRGQTDLEKAREAYLDVVEKWIDEAGLFQMDRYLEDALKIAKSPEDQVGVRVDLAQLLGQRYEPESMMRAGRLLGEATGIAVGEKARGEVLELYARWMQSFGRSSFDEKGEFVYHGNLEKSLELYKEILSIKDKNDLIGSIKSRAERNVAVIEESQLSFLIPYTFKPGREVQFPVTWKNVEAPRIKIYPIDYIESVQAFGQKLSDWKLGDLPTAFEVDLKGKEEHPYESVTERVRVNLELPAGSYLVEAESGEEKQRGLLLVTGLSVVDFNTDDARIVFVCESGKGIPLVNAEVWVIQRNRKTDAIESIERYETDADGLVRLPNVGDQASIQEIVARSSGSGVTLSGDPYQWWRWSSPGFQGNQTQMHVMTERTLYRPGEVAHAKIWLRLGSAGNWRLPAVDEVYEYAVINQGADTILKEGKLTFNPFGSAALEVPVSDEAALGPYVLRVKQSSETGKTEFVRTAFLWNVEAYRIPDFKGVIELSGGRGGYRTGDAVEGTVQVDYYSGGAVEEAAVQLVIRRRELGYNYWNWERGWSQVSGGYWEEVEQSSLVTDATGAASFVIKTEGAEETDFEYEVEARVRDLSRREVSFTKRFRVTQQPYSVELKTDRVLVKPMESVHLEVRTLDANEEPVSVDGRIRVTRERWRETYIHRKKGSEIEGDAYRALPERSMLNVAQSDYRLKESGFVTEEVEFDWVRTDESGRYEYQFEPKEIGYYTLTWIGDGERGLPIKDETSLWVSEKATQEMGYRPSGLEIIGDRGPFTVGQRVPYLLAAPSTGCFVLLVKNAGTVLDYSVQWIEGRTKMMELSIDKECVPNVFLNAYTIVEERGLSDQHEFLVPPVKQYLEVTLTPDDDGYEPKDEALVRVKTRDFEGNPVSAELAFSVTDEGIYSLLEDAGKGITDTYYGRLHQNRVHFSTSMDRLPFFIPEDELERKNILLRDMSVPLTTFSGDMGATDFREALSYEAGVSFDRFADRGRGYTALNSKSATSFNVELNDMVEPVIALRENFKASAYWNPSVVTDANGEAEIRFTLPDNLTEWRMKAVGATADTLVGEAQLQTTTRLPLIARLQVPRFLTERDEVIFSGTYQNNTEHAVDLDTDLKVSGGLQLLEGEGTKHVSVDVDKVGRTEWRVQSTQAGVAEVELRGSSGRFGDAVKRSLTVYPHGIARTVGIQGQTDTDRLELKINLPEAIEENSLAVRLELLPNLGGLMMGALPFLIDYPYGCVEQTMSRFLPALSVKRALLKIGYTEESLSAMESALGIANRIEELDTIIASGIKRLEEMQLEDGSWPWMPEGPSNPYMTAYVLWGLSLAEEYGVSLEGIRLEAGRERLERLMVESELSLADQCWLLHGLAVRYHADGFGRPTRLEARTFLNLMNERGELRPVSLALLALTGKYFGFDQDAQLLVRQLANSVRTENGVLDGAFDGGGNPITLPTTSWGKTSGFYFWADNAVESTALVLSALLAIDSEHTWVESTVNWLVRNRSGNHWGNTRATALVVLALTDYLKARASEEASTYALFVNDLPVAEEAVLSSGSGGLSIDLNRDLFQEGSNQIRIERVEGNGQYYFGLNGDYYTKAEHLAPVESDLRVERAYWYLKPVATLLDGWKETLSLLEDGDSVESGQRVEVVLRLETKRDLKYVLLEDIKPAGFETVQLLSGWGPRLSPVGESTNPGPRVYQELGDRKTGFMIERLPAGVWELRYRLRAEALGTFHGMPAKVEAMYLNRVSGQSAEIILKVKESVK